jgi:hypothetical protein
MNRITFVFALLVGLALASSSARAQGPAGSFGAGVESPLAIGPLFDGPTYLRVPGLSLRFQVGESFGLQLIAAVRTVGFVNDGDNARATFGGGYLRAHVRLVQAENLHLGAFGGVGLGGVRLKEGPVDASDRVLTLEGGLRPELFVADGRVSLHFQLGISMAIAFADGAGFVDDGFGFGFGRNADLIGNAGLTIWFGGSGPSSSAAPASEGGASEAGSSEPAAEPAPSEPLPDWETGGY